MRRVYSVLLAAFLIAGCAQEVEGPEPQLDDDPEQLSTDPSFVCNADHDEEGTWVTLDGEAFSPLIVDAIASEHDDDVELPTATLIRRLDPYGEQTDESFETTLESPLGSDDGQIRWLDGETLQLRITDDLELLDGVYDITVRNPNGQSATETEAFGVMDRPELHTAIPELTCVAQGERDVVLEGENLLVEGETLFEDADDQQVPTFRLFNTEMEVEQQVEVIDTADCRELHSTFTGHRLCEEVTVRLEEQSFEPGVYTVSTETFDPARCANLAEEDGVTVTIHPPPEAHEISPTPVCSEQIDYESMAVDGDEFVVVEQNGETVYPNVAIGDAVYDAHTAEECEDIDTAPALSAQKCTRLLIDVHEGDLSDQVAADETYTDLHVEVTNPDPVGCHSTEDTALTATPPPMVDVAAPDPMCTSQFENTVTVDGFGFLSIGDGEPVVHIGDETYEVESMEECTDVPTPDEETASCERVTVVVPAGDLALEDLEPEANDIVVENPETAHCSSTDDAHVQVVHPPVVEEVEPDPICTEQETRTLRIDGAEFLEIDEELGEVTIGDETFEVTELEDCEELELHEDGREVHRCTTLFVDVDAGVHDPGTHEVMVTNPEPADCWSEEQLDVETVPPPTITAVEPRALCTNADETLFDVYGEHLYEVDGESPTIELDEETYETEAFNCSDVEDDTRLCERLEFEASPDDVSDGLHSLVAINPDEVGCSSEPSEPIMLAGPPVIDTAEPMAICEDEPIDADMTLFGEFLHDPDGDPPEVTMNGTETTVDGFDDCDTTDLGDIDINTCGELYTTVPQQLRDDPFEITVTASNPVACGSDTLQIERVERATVTDVVPERVCTEGGSIDIYGENIHPDAEVTLDGVAATEVDVEPDGTQATATFDGPLDRPDAILEVVNPGDCGSTYEEEIHVAQAPIPLYVDPPAAYDGMDTQVTIYAAGISESNIEEVELVHPDTGETTLLDTSIDPDRPYVVQATVPQGMLDPSETSVDFGVRIGDQFDCQSDSFDLLTITSEPTVAIEEITPPFGAEDEDTGVIITAKGEDDLEADEEQFVAVPRVYLNPNDTEATDPVARELSAVQFIDETELHGIVSSGLPLGLYDLIVVNPDGSVGVLEEAYSVTELPPPFVDSVSPGSWTNDQNALEVDVEGENFRDDAEVEVFCRDPGDPDDDLEEPNDITIVSLDDELIELEVDTNNLDHLDACFMRVTNTDGTWGEYSPITITNPAGKFVEFNPGAAYDLPRRGPTAFSGVPSRQNHYLYVVGGDDGSTTGDIYESGEFTALDRFGNPREWRYLEYGIEGGRTLADGVRVDDFVYLIGGADDTGMATDEILRAHVLDPSEAPEITGIDLMYDEEDFEDDDDTPDADDGLEAGTYYYRVSAVYSGDDPANPGGESLGSDPQPITVPLDGATVTISWDRPEVTNHDIIGYNVYRTVNPDDPYGDESFLAAVDDATFEYTDDDDPSPAAGDNPLRLGSLGTWHHVADLEHGRLSAGVDSIQNPEADDEYLIYVVGGRDADGELKDDYEVFSVVIDEPRHQSVGMTPQTGAIELPTGRADLSVGIAHGGNAASVAGIAPQLFAFGGDDDSAGPAGLDDVLVASVQPDGHLDEWTAINDLSNTRHAHAGAAINDNLVVAGGDSGNTAHTAHHAELTCDADCPPANTTQWSSLSDVQMEERAWMGDVTFRGFWYLTGGTDQNDEPSNTVDFSVAGGTP